MSDKPGRADPRAAYEAEFHQIEAIQEEIGEAVQRFTRIPAHVRYAEQQLASAPEDEQHRVAAAAGVSLETLRMVLQQSFAPEGMTIARPMLQAGMAITGMAQPVPLAPIRRASEQLRGLVRARDRILDVLAEENPTLPDNVIIVE